MPALGEQENWIDAQYLDWWSPHFQSLLGNYLLLQESPTFVRRAEWFGAWHTLPLPDAHFLECVTPLLLATTLKDQTLSLAPHCCTYHF